MAKRSDALSYRFEARYIKQHMGDGGIGTHMGRSGGLWDGDKEKVVFIRQNLNCQNLIVFCFLLDLLLRSSVALRQTNVFGPFL